MNYIEENGYAEKWMMVKETIFPILISREIAIKSPQIPSRLYLDMAVICAVWRTSSREPEIRVCTTENLSAWGIDEETLYKQSLLNLKANAKYYQYKPVEMLIEELVAEQCLPESVEDIVLPKIPLYVLTNREKMFGAAILLNREYLKRISEGRSCFIIPSSIHEILILWDVGIVTQNELNLVVQDINAKLFPGEQLATHSYYYDPQKDELRIWKDMPDTICKNGSTIVLPS